MKKLLTMMFLVCFGLMTVGCDTPKPAAPSDSKPGDATKMDGKDKPADKKDSEDPLAPKPTPKDSK